MKNHLRALWLAWDKFWFAPRDLYNLALMRILLCGTMSYLYLFRLGFLSYYDERGWMPRAKALLIFPEAIRPPFAWFFWPDSWNLPVHVLLVLSLLLLTLGIGGRALMILAWVLDMGFLQRNFSVNFGADIVCALFLFFMCFTRSCERLSLWNQLRRRPPRQLTAPLSSMGIRLLQVQLCVIYTYTGFEKLKGSTWWDGTAVWGLFANPQMVFFDMSFMRHFPTLIAVATYLTVLFEIFFVPGILSTKTRPWWLATGILFHGLIALVVGLLPFSAAMLSVYFLFWPSLEARLGGETKRS